MKLKVLVDNNTYIDEYYLGEPAVSYYIEIGTRKILFDVGYSEIFMSNAEKMSIDLDKVDTLVISHGHDDHTGGLKDYFKVPRDIQLIAHPECFNYKEKDGLCISSPKDKNALSKLCKLNLSDKPVEVCKDLIFLGEIPRLNDFEGKDIIGEFDDNGKMVADLVCEDSALVYKTEKGLFIITGCSHSGICNILEYAKKVCNDDRIYGVIGGFHLFDKGERLDKTINYLKENNIDLLYPCHCVSLDAKIEMGKVIDIKEVGVGLEIDL